MDVEINFMEGADVDVYTVPVGSYYKLGEDFYLRSDAPEPNGNPYPCGVNLATGASSWYHKQNQFMVKVLEGSINLKAKIELP